jgi:hypothetical protein
VPQHQGLDELVFDTPLQMPMLVKAKAAQELPHRKGSRAACETFPERQTRGESKIDLRDFRPTTGQSALRDYRSERLNLPYFFVTPLWQRIILYKAR